MSASVLSPPAWPGGAILHALRRGHGVSPATLAASLGLRTADVTRLEQGRIPPAPAILSAWVHVCPLPTYPAPALTDDLVTLGATALAPPHDHYQLALELVLAHTIHGPTTAGALHLPVRLTPTSPRDVSVLVGLAWLALRVGAAASCRALPVLTQCAAVHEWGGARGAWTALLDQITEVPPRSSPDPTWQALQPVWAALTPPGRQALLQLAQAAVSSTPLEGES